MITSWKTSVCGIIGGCLIGISNVPSISPSWQGILRNIGECALALGVILARDFNKSSEDQKIVTTTPVEPPKP